MKIWKRTAFAGILGAMLLSGCAMNVSTIEPDMRAFTLENKPSATATVFIREVKDKRVFAENGRAYMPTWSNDGTHEEARAVGRKRNSFGMAEGGLVLPEGMPATEVVKKALSQALIDDGYKVVQNPSEVTDQTRVLDVDMDQFWCWVQMGFWALALNGDISAQVRPEGEEPVTVQSHVMRRSIAATDGGWLNVLNDAIHEFYLNAKDKFRDSFKK